MKRLCHVHLRIICGNRCSDRRRRGSHERPDREAADKVARPDRRMRRGLAGDPDQPAAALTLTVTVSRSRAFETKFVVPSLAQETGY